MQKSLHSTGYARFREILKQARVNAGLTQHALARKLGEGQDFVSKTERGVRRLDVVELREYCGALGIPFVEFTEMLDHELPRTRRSR